MPEHDHLLPQWAPRVQPALVRRLYESDAQGIYDEALIDEVGYALYSRCLSFIEANEAVHGRAVCPQCRKIVTHPVEKSYILACSCGWSLPWADYFATIQRRQLSGAEPVLQLFQEFVMRFPQARKPPEKVLLIDRLLHGFHWSLRYGAGRPVAVNLLEGSLADAVRFLDTLSYGVAGTPGLRQTQAEWLEQSRTIRRWGLNDRRTPMIAHANALLERILRHEDDYWTTVARREARDGWSIYHNPDLATRYDPNHAGVFRAPEGSAGAVVAPVIAYFTARDLDPVAYVDTLATPSDLEWSLIGAGFRNLSTAEGFGAADLLVYVGPDRAPPSDHAVEVVTDAAGRAAWAGIMDEAIEDPDQRTLFQRLHLAEIADARVTAYLARVDTMAVARCLRFSQHGLARIEVVRTLAAYRGRGLATAVIRRAVTHALERGDLPYLYAEQGGDAQRLYERLGFRTIAKDVMRTYVLARAT